MSSAAPDTRPPVMILAGPTAAGKTPLAIELAERFDAEIVNADSMQVYRFMDIGTAKPSLEQRSRVPHHMLDRVTPEVVYSAGRYGEEARAVARDLHAKGKNVVLTGGTGLYIRAFVEGLLPGGAANPELRAALEAEDVAARAASDPGRLHRRLQERDPESARSIHPNDSRRIVRALEITEQGGVCASARRREHGFRDQPFRTLTIAVDPGREALDARIDERCARMLEAGLLQEVRDLRERGYGPELRPMQAIGYRHVNPVADGSDTLRNALEAMRRDTRRFARRQRTWLRAVPSVVWLRPDEKTALWKTVEGFLAPGPERGASTESWCS